MAERKRPSRAEPQRSKGSRCHQRKLQFSRENPSSQNSQDSEHLIQVAYRGYHVYEPHLRRSLSIASRIAKYAKFYASMLAGSLGLGLGDSPATKASSRLGLGILGLASLASQRERDLRRNRTSMDFLHFPRRLSLGSKLMQLRSLKALWPSPFPPRAAEWSSRAFSSLDRALELPRFRRQFRHACAHRFFSGLTRLSSLYKAENTDVGGLQALGIRSSWSREETGT